MAATAPRRTKIVATIGPASAQPDRLRALIDAGMDAARLNLSHGSHDDHAERARILRGLQEECGKPLALIGDLQGPKIRVGALHAPLPLPTGGEVTVVYAESAPDGELPIAPAVVGEVLRPGHEVLIDDGMVRLRVEETEPERARCGVLVGGTVTAHKGVNLPGVPIPIPSLTRKDLADLEFALEVGVDYVALSFVRSAADVRDLKALLEQEGSPAHVIAKIEKAEAIDALDEVLAETDAVMVARGDLGVEIGPAGVPLVQKRIILKALERGKPVMLSGETAVGSFPVEAIRTMDLIARAVEPSLGYRHQLPEASEMPTVGQAMSNASCDLAEALGAKAMLVPTYTGRTASVVARLRPRRSIIGLTHHHYTLRQMALEWGVTPHLIPECADVEALIDRSIAAALESGLVEQGDRVVITAGTAVNLPGTTDLIKVA